MPNTVNCSTTGQQGFLGPSSNGGSAAGLVNTIKSSVVSRLSIAKCWGDRAKLMASSALDGLEDIDLPDLTIQFPDAPNIETLTGFAAKTVPVYKIPTVDAQSVTFTATGSPDDMKAGMPVEPTYDAGESIAQPPTPVLDKVPTRTTITGNIPTDRGDYSTPNAPTIQKPTDVSLIDIVVPEYTAVTLPKFTFEMPELTVPDGDIDISTTISAYTSAFLEKLIVRCVELMEGIHSYTADAEERMVFVAHTVAERDALNTIRKAESDIAARGFEMAPGALLDIVAEVELDLGRKLRETSAKIRDEITKNMQENQKLGLQTAHVIEQALSKVWLEEMRQKVEIERVKFKIAYALYAARVDIFNAVQKAHSVYSTAFLSQIEAYKQAAAAQRLQIEGALAKASLNNARLSVYESDAKLMKLEAEVYTKEVQALTLAVEEYEAYLSGVKAKTEIDVANIETYSEEMKGYGAAVNAAVSYVDGITAYYRAEESKLQVDEANTRAAGQYTEAASKVLSAYRSAANSHLDVMNSNLATYKQAGNTNESYYRAKASELQVASRMINDHVSAYSQYVSSIGAANSAVIESINAANSYALAAEENSVRAQTLEAIKDAEQMKLDATIAAARATLASALAQTTMSAVNVSASANAKGSDNLDGSETRSISFGYNAKDIDSKVTTKD